MELYNALIKDTLGLLESGSPRVWPYRPGEEWKDLGQSELVLYSGDDHAVQRHYADDNGAIVEWLIAQKREEAAAHRAAAALFEFLSVDVAAGKESSAVLSGEVDERADSRVRQCLFGSDCTV